LSKLITNNRRDYESLAVELAIYPEKLQAIKNKLLVNLPTSSLFNAKLFTQNLESAYRTIYERYQNDLTPDHIFISNE
jgi:predicted O-linked N-acetylglucosamine transferase (SPINDLY family)